MHIVYKNFFILPASSHKNYLNDLNVHHTSHFWVHRACALQRLSPHTHEYCISSLQWKAFAWKQPLERWVYSLLIVLKGLLVLVFSSNGYVSMPWGRDFVTINIGVKTEALQILSCLGFIFHYFTICSCCTDPVYYKSYMSSNQSYPNCSVCLCCLWTSCIHHLLFTCSLSLSSAFLFPVLDPAPGDSFVYVILVSLLPLLVMGIVVVGMLYWYRAYRRRMLNREWESSIKKHKPKASGLDCSDACAIMMDDDRSDSSSTHANNLNHNTEPLPIELDLLVDWSSSILMLFYGPVLHSAILTKMMTFDALSGGQRSIRPGIQG